MTTDRPLVQVTTLAVADCTAILNRLVDGPQARFKALHDKIAVRREHYHNLKAANPTLPAPYTGKSEYQSDVLRRTHIKHRARITENPPVARVTPPRDTAKLRDDADMLEAVLNRIYDIVQERTGQNFQSLLSDGQDRDCYGILHWVKADHIWPKFPDADIRGELPEDQSEAKRYDAGPDGYTETDASRQERDKHAKARAGVPWHIEVVDPPTCGFVEDISSANGMAIFARVTEVGFLDYRDALRKDKVTISLNQADKRVLVGRERQRPDEQSDSGTGAWGDTLRVGEVWTRDECYELVQGTLSGSHTPWELVKSWKHPYEMPPFAIAYGHRNQHPDPVEAYEPVLEGLFRVKPGYDFVMALNEIIAQSIALPVWHIERENGTPRLDESGKPLVLSRDMLQATTLNPGEKLVKAEFELNPAFIGLMELRQKELADAAPSVGQSEISSTTQAWAILLQQQQASIEPKQIVLEQQRAIRTMFRNMAMVMSKPADKGGFGQPVYVYAKEQDGKVNSSTAIGIDPADIPTLDIDVDINPRSAAEVVTRTQLGVDLLEKRVITLPELYEDYMAKASPGDKVKANIAYWAFEDYVKAGVVKQEIAAKYAKSFVQGPNGTFIGMDGQQATPEQVLQANGQQPIPPPQSMNGAGGMPGGMAGGLPPMGAAPPGLPGLAVPGAMQQPGIPSPVGVP